MRIAFVSTIMTYPWGGADSLWTRAAEESLSRGDTVLLCLSALTAAHPRVTAMHSRGARLQIRSSTPAPPRLFPRIVRSLLPRPPAREPLLPVLEDFSPDLIVISSGGTYDLAAEPGFSCWLASGRIAYRLILNWQRENPTDDDTVRQAIISVFTAADALYFVSQRNLAVTRRHLMLPLANARVLHNPLRWTPADASPFPDSDTARLATVSRLDEVKGLHLLLHALKETDATAGAWQLAIHGLGPQESELRALVAHLGLQGRVSFRGHVADLQAIWAEHQLLCSPAIDDGVPMTIPEAMLCGRPVLATCVGGAEDWLQDRDTGFLCPAPTVPLLATTIQAALTSRAEWSRMGRDAAIAARGCYRPDDYKTVIAPPA